MASAAGTGVDVEDTGKHAHDSPEEVERATQISSVEVTDADTGIHDFAKHVDGSSEVIKRNPVTSPSSDTAAKVDDISGNLDPPTPRPYQLPETITASHDILRPEGLEVIAIGGSGYVYRCPGDLVYKMQAREREYQFMKAAGDCCITPVCRVTREIDGQIVTDGIVMELATPFDFKTVELGERAGVRYEMVGLLSRLHKQFGIVHGDVKCANFVRCRDGKLRFCDFDSARRVNDDEEEWEGLFSVRYLAPNRGWPNPRPPTVADDWYALAISIWELYTGKDAFEGEDMEELLNRGATVDLEMVEDEHVQRFIQFILQAGGARV